MAKLGIVRSPVLNAYVDDDDREIVFWEASPQGPVERRTRAEYVTWHRAEQLGADRMRQLKSLATVHSIKLDGEWVRIGWTDEWARRSGRSGMREYGITTYEGDVDPVRVWLTDSRITVARPRRCYLDIETDTRAPFSRKEEMRVLVWAISDDTGRVAHGVLRADDDDDEARLLTEMWKALGNYDQICAWYGGRPDNKDVGFDFYVLAQRTLKRGLSIDTRHWLFLDHLTAWERMNSAESGAEKESMRLEDIAQVVLGEGKTKAPKFVTDRFGDKKNLGALAWDLWEAGGEFRDLLVAYCIEDTELLRKLEAKKGYLALFQTVCEACGVFGATRGLFPSIQMDGFMLRLGRERNYRFATKVYRDEEPDEGKKKKFKGAWVMVPRSVGNDAADSDWTTAQARAWRHARGMTNGILTNVHVADFAGMYPNIILTWNLSPDTKAGRMSEKEWLALPIEEKKGLCRSPGTGLLTRTDREGILVIAVREMIRLRKYWLDMASSLPPGTPEWHDAMGRSTAYKVTANSFYGVVGQAGGRFFDVEIAESVTQNGVYMIKMTIREAERRKMEAIYSDTDSAMIVGPSRAAFNAFCNWCNNTLYPKIGNDNGCIENTTNLAFEKTLSRIVFTAAKRYIAKYSHGKKGVEAKADSKPEIKGIEYKRGDTNVLARHLQGQMIDLLMGGCTYKDADGKERPYNPGITTPTEEIEIYHSIISQLRDRVLSEPLTREEVRRSQSLSKPLREYEVKAKADGSDGNDLAHVGVAREMERRGESVAEGTRIEYIVVDGDASPMRVIPADDFSGDFDRFYLWDTMIYPPTERLLAGAFPDHDWSSWGNTRPKKGRKAQRVLEGQLGLSLGVSTRVDEAEELAVPKYVAKALTVRIPEAGGEVLLERVKGVLKQFPGARSVEILIELRSGGSALLTVPMRVSPSPAFKLALDEALAS
jgi:hypothetical protein